MSEYDSHNLDAEMAELDAALPVLLRAEISNPHWARSLRRRMLRQRWAGRLELLALALQLVLILGIVTLFHPWTWRWPVGTGVGLGPWLTPLLMGLSLAAAALAACWSLSGIGGSSR